jgi:4-amino-4-deoxy-L-arabinose transferase-like glycosyltransferase
MSFEKMNKNLIIFGCFILNFCLFITFLFTRYYSPFLMLLHIISLVLLACLVVDKKLWTFLVSKKKEILLICIFMLIAFLIRLYRVEEVTPGMYGDELTVAVTSLDLLKEPQLLPFVGTYSHPTPLMYLTALSIKSFGHTITAIRLPSIIFGALAVGAFYVLLRLFSPVLIASIGALLMTTQYTQVILSRLAYETISSMFFQIASLIFIILYERTKNNKILIFIALSVGAGLYTYLNFRIFSVLLILLTVYLILKKNLRKCSKEAGIFLLTVFIAVMPLLSYVIIDSKGFWGRASEISIFSQNFTLSEFKKELCGNIFRTTILPFYGTDNLIGTPPFSGDPNPDKNPSGVPMFDPITVMLAVIGLVYFLIKKRNIFFFLVIFFLVAFANDVFSIEKIPEAHYYGLGHPNALRLSGIIPIVLFLATEIMGVIYSTWGKNKIKESVTLAGFILIIICFLNSQWYFGQKNNKFNFYVYNYTFNHGQELQLVKYLNSENKTKISASNDLATSQYVDFFLDSRRKVFSFEPTATSSALGVVRNNEITAISVTDKTIPILSGMQEVEKMGYEVNTLYDPIGRPRTVVFKKT